MISEERRQEFGKDLTRTFRCYARFYDFIEWVTPLMRNNPRRVVAQAVPAEASMILDACTGNGAVLATVAASHPEAAVYGLDLSPDMLALAKRRVERKGLENVQIFTGDCTKMPFETETFDAVTGSYGLHEMPDDVRRAAVAEAFRVLKPGGTISIIDWDRPRSLPERVAGKAFAVAEPDWIVELFDEGLSDLLAGSGFEDVTVRRDVFLSQLAIATKPS